MGRLMETAAVSSSGAGVHTQEANCADLALVSKSLESLETTDCAAVDTGCELDKPEYTTDDFRLNSFKVTPCTNEQPHDWCLCPFAHPGEKAVRRDPRLHKYTGTSCPDYRKGSCKRGSGCPYAHGVFEVWLHPSRYRTQMCKDAALCTRQVCFFAHREEELRHVEPEEPLALEEISDSASGCSGLSRTNSCSTLNNDLIEQSNANWPKCGPNTNVKAAAAAKAKAAAATSASDKTSSSSSTVEKPDKSKSRRASILSRSSNSSSPATNSTARLAGLQSLGSLHSSYSSNSMISMLSQATLGSGGVANPAGSFGPQDWGLSSMLSSAGQVPGLALGLNGDMTGVNPTASCSACATSSLGLLCDNFGSLELAASAAGARALAGQQLAGGTASNPWGNLPAGSAAAAASSHGVISSDLSAMSLGLPAPSLELSSGLNNLSNLSNLAGQYNAAAATNLALAAVAHQAASKQQQHQELQELMTAVLLQQQQQSQHRQAMWNAAFTAAAGVGLGDIAAAACADAAVQNTTAASGAAASVNPARLQDDPLFPASGGLEVAGLQESQLLLQGASILQRQQQQQADLQKLLRGGLLAGIGGLSGMESFAGQAQMQMPIAATAGAGAGSFLQ